MENKELLTDNGQVTISDSKAGLVIKLNNYVLKDIQLLYDKNNGTTSIINSCRVPEQNLYIIESFLKLKESKDQFPNANEFDTIMKHLEVKLENIMRPNRYAIINNVKLIDSFNDKNLSIMADTLFLGPIKEDMKYTNLTRTYGGAEGYVGLKKVFEINGPISLVKSGNGKLSTNINNYFFAYKHDLNNIRIIDVNPKKILEEIILEKKFRKHEMN
ncbi:MAG: hypothetical protein ACP5NV_05695 [Candidatus Woesearchaeota archaeon]